MKALSTIPAAQYVRMSTDDQQFSIANQKAAIHEYAERYGFKVVTTYEDSGRSGVSIRNRDGLRRLLKDVMSGGAEYKVILVYDVTDNGTKIGNKKVFATCDKGYVTDGIRLDVDGNVWAGWYTLGPTDDNGAQIGVRVFSPQGKAIGRIATPEGITNLAWGGWARNRLFMVGGHSVYGAYLNVTGVGYFDN